MLHAEIQIHVFAGATTGPARGSAAAAAALVWSLGQGQGAGRAGEGEGEGVFRALGQRQEQEQEQEQEQGQGRSAERGSGGGERGGDVGGPLSEAEVRMMLGGGVGWGKRGWGGAGRALGLSGGGEGRGAVYEDEM